MTRASSGSASRASAVAKVLTPKRVSRCRRTVAEGSAMRRKRKRPGRLRMFGRCSTCAISPPPMMPTSIVLIVFSQVSGVDAEAGLQRHAGEVGEAELGVCERMGLGRVLLAFGDQPAVIAGVVQD